MSQTLLLIETHYTTRFSNTQDSEEQVIDNDTPSFTKITRTIQPRDKLSRRN